jgi:hypothetical protein
MPEFCVNELNIINSIYVLYNITYHVQLSVNTWIEGLAVGHSADHWFAVYHCSDLSIRKENDDVACITTGLEGTDSCLDIGTANSVECCSFEELYIRVLQNNENNQ